MKLTSKAVINAKPKEKAYKLSDGGGMYLHIQPSGKKYWRLKYRIFGKEKLLSLGVYPELSLKDAREKRDKARKQIADNIDPGAVKKEQRHHALLNAQNSFEAIANEWHKNSLNKWTEKHAERVWRRLERNIIPALGNEPIKNIKPSALLAAIRVIEYRGATDLSRRTLQSCSAIFRYAIATGRAEYNPAADLVGALKIHKREHYPTIDAKELPIFYERLEEVNTSPIHKLAIRLLLLTFLRQGELRKAKWEHVDFGAREWRIPPEHMKMKTRHIVPLADQAMYLLRQLQLLTGDSPYLFPSQHRRVHPVMSENTINKVLRHMGYKGKMVGHGVRSLASTVLNENGFKPDVIEKQLAHAERNAVRAAYNRAEYLDERRAMMEWWAGYLGRMESGGGNVVEGKFYRKCE